MAEHRPFPASPRRRALARQAGLHPASSWVVGGAATAAVVVAAGASGGALVRRLGAALAAACAGRTDLTPAALPGTVVAIALPILGAAALAAVIAHVAQTRAVWLPRRRVTGAPAIDAGAVPRTRRTAGDLAAAAAIGGVAFAWLWWSAPRVAVLLGLDPTTRPIAWPIADPTAWPTAGPTAWPTEQPAPWPTAPPGPPGVPAAAPPAASQLFAGTAALLANLGAVLAIAWLALGVLDAVARHAAIARALAMTAAEKREDDRLAGADPRWRARRAQIQRGPIASEAVAGASLLLLGDDAAVAVAWDPARRPIPIRTATGRGPRATQLLGLARRYRIAVHRDPALAAQLVDGDGPIPEPHWPRLAEIVAATRGTSRPV
jgi:flagellar biosynthesis protein FlhB